MPTLEDRLSALEREMTAIKLERLVEQQKAEKRFSSIERDVKRDVGDIHQYLTILVGLATVQNESLNALKEGVSVLKEDMRDLKGDVSRLEVKSNEHTELLQQILARLPEKA